MFLLFRVCSHRLAVSAEPGPHVAVEVRLRLRLASSCSSRASGVLYIVGRFVRVDCSVERRISSSRLYRSGAALRNGRRFRQVPSDALSEWTPRVQLRYRCSDAEPWVDGPVCCVEGEGSSVPLLLCGDAWRVGERYTVCARRATDPPGTASPLWSEWSEPSNADLRFVAESARACSYYSSWLGFVSRCSRLHL